MLKKSIVWLLMVCAAIVFVMQLCRVNAWLMICLYWALLTIKNALDLRR